VKEGGLGHYLYCNGFDLSGDTGSVSTIATRRAALDVTGIDKSAHERIGGLVDAELGFDSWFNPSDDQEHEALSVLTDGDKLMSYFAGAVVGNNCFNLTAKQTDYAPARAADGSLAISITAMGNGRIGHWADMLTTGKQTFASATNGTGLDYGATIGSTAFGGMGFLHVFSVGSGTATVAIQDSADGSAWANVTGLVFAGATARTTEVLATGLTATVRRHLRVNVTGAFTNAVIAVGAVKFLAAQS
jgi:hypothetical protein